MSPQQEIALNFKMALCLLYIICLCRGSTMKFFHSWLKAARRYGFLWIMAGLVLLFLIPRSSYPAQERWFAISALTIDASFDYIGWEINAIHAKLVQTLYGQHPFMDESARTEFVRVYMADIGRAQALEGQIKALYMAALPPDPAQVETLRTERDALRADLERRQLTAEAILEGQVSAVLVDEGFGALGQLWPPMAMHFTPVPNVLIISPRDRILMDMSLTLDALTTDQITAFEQRIEQDYNVSAFITSIGGMALYPAMITETSSIVWAVETFAHEWLHHYLMFHPLGLQYFTNGEGSDGEARILNETTADTFGKEVARLVLARYYPDLVPPPAPPPVPVETPSETEPLAFDFGREMHITRTHVDELLAAGKIDESEAYMEERRQFFIANGYGVRRINQAFFAFYGGYQGGGMPGVGGEDPIGPAIRALRLSSPTLKDFVITMQDLTTRADLLAAAARVGGISDPTSP